MTLDIPVSEKDNTENSFPLINVTTIEENDEKWS